MAWTTDNTPGPETESRIAALEATVADLRRRLEALESGRSATPYGSVQPEVSGAVDPWSVPPWPQLVQLIVAGKKIEAIKVYRENFGVGLKQAKDAVEEVERRVRG